MDDFDRATLTGVCVNGSEKQFDQRYADLTRRLRNDPSAPMRPKFTDKEMREAAQRLMTSVLTTGKLVS